MPNPIRITYEEIDILNSKNLNPLFILTCTPNDLDNYPNLFINNLNTNNSNGSIDSLFEVRVFYNGQIKDGNLGVIETLKLNSANYSSSEWFSLIATETTKTLNNFVDSNGGNVATKYTIYFETYSDIPTVNKQNNISFTDVASGSVSGGTKVKTSGSGCSSGDPINNNSIISTSSCPCAAGCADCNACSICCSICPCCTCTCENC